MPTINQLVRNPRRISRAKSKSPALKANPFRRGVCGYDDANTQETKFCYPQGGYTALTTGIEVIAYISMKVIACKSIVACPRRSCEGSARVRYIVRGTLDCGGVEKRRRSRSKYGVQASQEKLIYSTDFIHTP